MQQTACDICMRYIPSNKGVRVTYKEQDKPCKNEFLKHLDICDDCWSLLKHSANSISETRIKYLNSKEDDCK